MANKINDPRIEFTSFFNKKLKQAPHDVQIAFRETLALFIDNSDSPHLRNHTLKEKLAGYKSIDVTQDWRALFRETQTGRQKIVTFHLIGTHEELYKEK